MGKNTVTRIHLFILKLIIVPVLLLLFFCGLNPMLVAILDINTSLWTKVYLETEFDELYKGKLDDLKETYDLLTALEPDNYYEINNQYLEIPNFNLGDKFIYGSEYRKEKILPFEADWKGVQVPYHNVKTMQLSPQCFDTFNIQINIGAYLPQSEYTINSNSENLPIHVLLGADYSSHFSIGDVFQGKYLFRDCNFIVTGFLKPNTIFKMGNDTIQLDSYIVMPSLNLNYTSPVGSEDYNFQVRQYVNKLSGILNKSLDDTHVVFDKMREKPGGDSLVGKIEIWPVISEEYYEFLLKMNKYIVGVAFILGIIFFVVYNKYRKENVNISAGNKKECLKSEVILIITIIISNILCYLICMIMDIKYLIISIFICLLAYFVSLLAFHVPERIRSLKAK